MCHDPSQRVQISHVLKHFLIQSSLNQTYVYGSDLFSHTWSRTRPNHSRLVPDHHRVPQFHTHPRHVPQHQPIFTRLEQYNHLPTARRIKLTTFAVSLAVLFYDSVIVPWGFLCFLQRERVNKGDLGGGATIYF